MNPLLKRLASLRVKVRLLDGWQGACALVALVLGVAVTVGVLDYFVHLPTLFRAATLVGLLVGSGAIVYRYIVRPFGKPCDDLNLALRIEDNYPELNDALASTVQFLKQSKEDLARVGGSAAMRERTVAVTLEKAATCDFSRVLDRKGAALFGAAAVCVLVIAGVVAGTQREYAGIALKRLLEPFGGHTWTQLAVYRLKNNKEVPVDGFKEERIAIRQPYFIRVDLTGQLPEKLKQARIEIDGQIRTDSNEPIVRKDGAVYFEKRFDMSSNQPFKFRIVYNDGTFPPRANSWHEVKVLPEPKLVDLDGQPSPQITLEPPVYTDLPREKRLLPGTRDMQLYAGTKVVYRAKADRPLTEAWLEYHPTHAAHAPAAVFAAALGQQDPIQVAGRAVASQSVWSRIPVKLEGDGSLITANFTAYVDGRYSLHMNDENELEGQEGGNVHVVNDPLPEVKLQRPVSSVKLYPDGKLEFKFNVTDEQFAVRSVFVEYRRRGPDGNYIDDEPKRTVLYEAKGFGALIPEMLAKMAYVSPASSRTYPKFPARGGDLRLRPQKLEFQTVWALKKQFQEREVIEIQVCADDFCDIFGVREPGRSHVIELRIVGKRELTAEADAKMGQIKQELKEIRNIQQQALDTVKETRTKDKVDAKELENFNDNAEAAQRAVKDRVGNLEQGLRKELNDLRRTLKENNMEGTPAAREADEIKGALDNIANEELQKIEPKIADARKELAQTGKNTDQSKQNLKDAAKMQQNVVDSLNELIQKMDPTAKMNDQKAQLREIIEREKKIRQDLEELNTRKQELEKEFPDQKDRIEKDQMEKIAQKAMEQRELAQQMEKLLKEMRAEKEQLEKAGQKEEAKKLEDAIEKLEKPQADPVPMPKQPDPKDPINAQIRKIAEELKNKSEAPQKTLDKQDEIVKQLENALNDLEGKNEDMTKQEIQKRKDAEQKIDQLQKKLQELRDQAKKNDMIEDKEERLKKKEELVGKMEKVIDEIEKTRRELARLQEQRAANDAKQAADKVDEARQKAENGQNPDQDLKQAQEDLARVKEALKEAEEQLARELLIRIADQLKVLKERQDAVLQRSEDFHPKVIMRKIWDDGLMNTIEGNMAAQKDIADETDGLKDKLKGAKVFHGILEGAKKSMDGAGEVMKNRRDEGKDRREEKLNAQEINDENEWHADTVRHQKQAAKKLGHILDALKEEIAKARPKKKEQQAKNDQKDPKEEDKKPKG